MVDWHRTARACDCFDQWNAWAAGAGDWDFVGGRRGDIYEGDGIGMR